MKRVLPYWLSLVFLLLGICSMQAQKLYTLDQLDTLYTYTSIKEAQQNPEAVVKLKLRKNKLDSIPPAVFTFKNLQYLNLEKNKIDTLPGGISQLENLQVLKLNKNVIREIPEAIGSLHNLKKFHIGENMLVFVDPAVGNLKNLEYWDIWSNDLEGLPNTIKNLNNLKELDMRVNAVKEEKQVEMQDWLPKAKMHFSYDCDCY